MVNIEPLEFIASLIEFNGVVVETADEVLTHEITYKLADNTKYVIVRSASKFNVVGVYKC